MKEAIIFEIDSCGSARVSSTMILRRRYIGNRLMAPQYPLDRLVWEDSASVIFLNYGCRALFGLSHLCAGTSERLWDEGCPNTKFDTDNKVREARPILTGTQGEQRGGKENKLQ